MTPDEQADSGVDTGDVADPVAGAVADPVAGAGADATARLAAVEAELDALQRESRERHAELRDLAAALPAATSRRAVVSEMARSVRDAPDRTTVVRRVVTKVARTPLDLLRRRR